jgi:hypothetical protein
MSHNDTADRATETVDAWANCDPPERWTVRTVFPLNPQGEHGALAPDDPITLEIVDDNGALIAALHATAETVHLRRVDAHILAAAPELIDALAQLLDSTLDLTKELRLDSPQITTAVALLGRLSHH